MSFKNIGNFARKVSEFNAQRRDKNLEKMRLKAQSAEIENKKIQEEMQLRKALNKNKELKRGLAEAKREPLKKIVERFSNAANNLEKKENKMNVLGNSNKKQPELFSKNPNTKFKF